MSASTAANADAIVRTFSGSGASGDLGPGATQEPWSYGSTTPILSAGGAATTDVGWGSPGVSKDLTPSGESVPVSSFEITYTSATLDPAQITLGAASDCVGDEFGGTVFCSESSSGVFTAWTATAVGTDGIMFTAPAGILLDPGNEYFVNIMLDAGGSGSAFTGSWDTAAAVPEPTSLALLGIGLAGLGLVRGRHRKPA